jgi:RNA polymerase sigma-70 factor (ECF subfamily)
MNVLLAPANPLPNRRTPEWPRRESVPPRRPVSQQKAARCPREVCERLFRDHHAQLQAVARKMLHSEHDAADAVQDAFVAAFTSLDRFQERSQLSTWLHRIVVNCCLMKLRARQRRQIVSLELIADVPESPVCDPLPPGHDFQMEQEESRQLVHRALDRLSADHREIIVLRDIQELDTDTTARLLAISRSAAKTRLHRARQALRVQIELLNRAHVTRDS